MLGEAVPAVRRTFAALQVRNFRRYFVGQAISLTGTWMQRVAQSWLVLELTGSATAVGLVVGLQTISMLVLGPYAGLVADRVDKRRLITALQYVLGGFALLLGSLTVIHAVRLWQVYTIAVLVGLASTFETPARQSFIGEMVGDGGLRNAVSLNSVLSSLARVLGPAVGGFVIAWWGTGACFLLNALTFVAVIILLRSMDVVALRAPEREPRARGQLRAGLAHVRGSAELAGPLLMMLIISCLAYEFEVLLPLLATQGFTSGAQTYGLMTGALGAGAMLGGLYTAARGRTGLRPVCFTAAAMSATLLLAAAAPTLPLELAALVVVGAASTRFIATGNATVQLAAPVGARGRIVALWQVAFVGSRSVGAPLVGSLVAVLGPRATLATGAAACLAATGLGLWLARQRGRPTD